MTTTDQNQAGFDDFDVVNTTSNSAKKPITQRQIIGEFGSGGDIGEYDIPGATVGNDEIVMWFPEDVTAPLDIEIEGFTPTKEWEEGETEVEDEDTRVYVLEAGDHHHVVDANKIDSLADALNTSTEELLGNAKTKTGGRNPVNYPVLYKPTEGNILVSPIIRKYHKIKF